MTERIFGIRLFLVLTILILSIRLFSIQIIDKTYKKAAEGNFIKKIIDYPYRGLIYDRYGELLVYNEPVFDIEILPREAKLEDSVDIKALFDITQEDFDKRYQKARRFSKNLSSIFYEKLSNERFAKIQDRLIDFEGFSVQSRITRGYTVNALSNALGYVGQVTSQQIGMDTSGYYKSGDNIGVTGIENTYEEYLRGLRGVRFNKVDVRGVYMGAYENGSFDTLSIPGLDIRLTVDAELQLYAEKLMKDKIGSVVAIDPTTGEILALVSSPTYDPVLLTGREYSKNYLDIQSDTTKPLFNRPLQAMYPPGSMFKTIQALIALQDHKIEAKEIIKVDGSLIGDHAPPGPYDVERAITKSSNNYFFKVFRRVIQQGIDANPYIDTRIGFENWRIHVLQFGFGQNLGVDLPNEKSGFVPSLEFYDKIYGKDRWKFSNIYSLSIGQGELNVTPMQMANLGAILANRGFFYAPHIVKKVGDINNSELERHFVGVDSAHFQSVLDGMQALVSVPGSRGYIPGLIFCGKTSTVQNSQGIDHSGFMGFAPRENPKIAIAVYVENSGWGARAALSTASLLIEKYITGTVKKVWLEEYVLKGDFEDAKPN
ncbi:MAG: peptidoglycan glycosyltransferase [Flammeovirgaceae bacterium]|nr:peptidoglycan glycosyltransferase [Flammeovirgaceae bacterium]